MSKRPANVRREALFAARLAGLVGSSPASADVTAGNGAIVRDAFQRWADGTSIFPALLSPDVAWTVHGLGPGAAPTEA
jgi:hypothetical protein